MGLASIIVLGVVGMGVLVLVAGIIDGEWELRQRDKKNRGVRQEKPKSYERARKEEKPS